MPLTRAKFLLTEEIEREISSPPGTTSNIEAEFDLASIFSDGTKPSPSEALLLATPRRQGFSWRKNNSGDPMRKPVTKKNLLGALSFTRGIFIPTAVQCEYCMRGCGPLARCAVAIGENETLINKGSCANCTWHGKGKHCTFSKYKEVDLTRSGDN
jgi:hypothetical protein